MAENQAVVSNKNRPLPMPLTLTWDKELFAGEGGFVVRFHATSCMGIVLHARSWYTHSNHGDFLDIQYEIIKKPKDLPQGYLETMETMLKKYFAMGRRSAA